MPKAVIQVRNPASIAVQQERSEKWADNQCTKVPRLAARSSEKVPYEMRARSADDTRALLPHAGNCIGNMAFHFKRLGCVS